MKILIVDDDPSCAVAMASYFTTRGYEVEVASEIEQAEALVCGGKFDAVITDVWFTGVRRAEGLALLHFIRARGVSTRVMVITAHDGRDIRQAAAVLGAEKFFVKPVPLDEVAAVLDRGGADGH